jgi:hypothetical protein
MISLRNRSAVNVSNLMNVTLTVSSEDNVCNNHTQIELNSTVCTGAVCFRKKPIVGSPFSTIDSNVNVTENSTNNKEEPRK